MNSFETIASRYEALLGIFDMLQEHQHLEELVRGLPENLRRVVDFRHLSVMLMRPRTNKPYWYLAPHCDPSALVLTLDLPVEHEWLSWAYQHQQAAIIPDQAFEHCREWLRDRELELGYAVPLTVADRRIGAMFLGRTCETGVPAEEVRFLSTVAGRIALAAEHLLLWNDTATGRENAALRDEVASTSMFEEIVGSSESLYFVLSQVAKVAPENATVLITGESNSDGEDKGRIRAKRSRGRDTCVRSDGVQSPLWQVDPEDLYIVYNAQMESARGSFRGLQTPASSTDQEQPDGIRSSQDLTGQVIFEILEMILAGRSLQKVLTCVARVVEAQREDEGMLCSVWLLDEDRVHMRAIAAPTLPESYIAALDGFAVGPEEGTCGAAVNRREPIIVSDVLTDPIHEQVRDVLAAHGIRTCWSAPIISQQGEILGTFAFYFRSVRVANPSDMQLIDAASRIAATAIERKRAEQAQGVQNTRLRESQRELSLIIDNIPGFVWCASTDGQLTYINKPLSEYVGASVDNLSDAGWLDAVHPDDRAIALDIWMRCVATGAPLENQYRLRGADGVYRWFHVPRQLGHTSDGQPTLWYGLLVDIEERKSAEQALRQQERELRRLLDFMPQLVVVFGPGHERLYANRAALEYRGLDLDEWREAHTVHPDDQNRVREYVSRASLTGEPYDLEVRLCNGEGHYRWFLASYSPMHDEKGKVKYWYVALTDIEDRKKAEERLQQENLALREEIDHASMFEEIVGTSPALGAVLSRISQVAQSDSTVLISGETGTGKELIARGIHRRSNRASRAFISVNCAAIPRDLVLSELFGHEKGAFTGATQRRIGRFELADGGTIFLDEVGELSHNTQLLLLRVLQEREFERVGAEQSIRVNVRVIAATNRELKAAVANGAFREDLFYRLNVFPIPVPPLRERKNDILMLVEYFVQRYATKMGKTIRSIDKKTLDALQSYNWPGNIRELQNVIERSVILTFGDVLLVDESWLSHETSRPNSVVERSGTIKTTGASRTEREIIETVLAETRGRVSDPSGAAAKQRIPSYTLATRIKALKINRSKFKFPD